MNISTNHYDAKVCLVITCHALCYPPALLASNIFKAMIKEKDFVKILPS
jgi:hypothetical protein